MGSENIKIECLVNIKDKIKEEILSLANNKPDNNFKAIIDKYVSFMSSNDFIPFCLVDEENFFFNIFDSCPESFQNNNNSKDCLFLKILFPLLEELKKINFDEQLRHVSQLKKEQKNNILMTYYNKHKSKKDLYDSKLMTLEIKSYKINLQIYGKFFSYIINEVFRKNQLIKNILTNYDIFEDCTSFVQFYFEETEQKEIIILRDYLIQLEPSLNYTKDLCNIFIGVINIYINKTKIKHIDKESDQGNKNSLYNEFLKIMKINKYFIWTLYEQQFNTDKKFKTMAFIGEKTAEGENLTFNVFEPITLKEMNKSIYGFVCKSMFTNNEIMMIKIDIERYRKNETDFSEFKNEINLIIESNKSNKNLHLYILIGNKAFKYPQLYNLFLEELIKKKLFNRIEIDEDLMENNESKNNNPEIENNKSLYEEISKKNEIENNSIIDNKNIINSEQAKDSINLEINKLKKELNEEKLKNKDLEKKVNTLEKQLNEEKTKNNEKEKEIKELKEKLMVFPLELNNGEKLIIITVSSFDQKVKHSLVCKNTEIFNDVENRFYQISPEYKEKNNNFIVKGNKVDKNKTLQENEINNNDMVILNVID